MRILPGQVNSRVVTSGQKCVGASSRKPSGSACSAPLCTTKVRRNSSRVRTRRGVKPMRSHSCSAHGFSEMNESGPASMTKPSTRSVAIEPPEAPAGFEQRHARRPLLLAAQLDQPVCRRQAGDAAADDGDMRRWVRRMPAATLCVGPQPASDLFGATRRHRGSRSGCPTARMLRTRNSRRTTSASMRMNSRMIVHRRRAHEVYATPRPPPAAPRCRGRTAPRHDRRRSRSVPRPRRGRRRAASCADDVADVGLEPRLARVAAAALVGNRPPRVSDLLGDQLRALGDLRHVGRRRGHRRRDAVRREDQRRGRATLRREYRRTRHATLSLMALDEQRMRVPARRRSRPAAPPSPTCACASATSRW